MSGFDSRTLDFYAAEAPVYTASGPGGVSRHLDAFLDRLSAGAHILELGCGGGIDAAHMQARGFSIDATDGVSAMAARAERRLGRAVRVMRFDELDSVDEYDATVANASLLHVPRTDLGEILGRIWRALRPGGWHLATYKGGGSEGRDRFGRYFNYLAAEEARKVYSQSGHWASIAVEKGMGGGYDGVEGPWIRIVARKQG